MRFLLCFALLRRCSVGLALLTVSLLLPGHGAAASAWTTRVWQASDGLTDDRVTGVVQTPDGFIWVGTLGKLLRFNGSSFEPFTLSTIPGVIGYGPRAMYADSRGNLWLQSQREKLLCLGANSARTFDAAAGVPAENLTGFAEDSAGTVWLAYGARTYRVEGLRLRPVELPGGEDGGGSVSLVSDRSGGIWWAQSGRLGIIAHGTFEPTVRLPGAKVVLAPARGAGVWAGTGTRIFRVVNPARPAAYAALPAGAHPSAIIEDSTGAVWVGTSGQGLFRCAGGGVEHIETSHLEISSLLEDREGSIWAGTRGGGLNRLRPRAMELIGPRSGPPYESVRSVSQDSGGLIWAVTGNGELAAWDGKNWNAFAGAGNGGAAPFTCVAADRQGRLWVGTQGQGLREIDQRGGAERRWGLAERLPSQSVRALLVARDDSVWLATDNPARLCHLQGEKVEIMATPPGVRTIRALVQGARGEIWVGTSDGQVLTVAGRELVSDPTMAAAPQYSVRCLCPTPDGSLWIGYASQGIGWLNHGKFSRLTTEQGLTDDTISQIAADAGEGLWVASSLGLYRIALDAAVAVAEGRQARLVSARFGREEGLRDPQVNCENAPAVVQDRQGRILFSTSLGVMVLHPEKLRDHPIAPPVFIERVVADDHPVALRHRRFPLWSKAAESLSELSAPDTLLRLPPGNRQLTFEFAVLSYADAENVRVRYRLEGVDDAWVERTQERSAHYAHLPAGHYLFRVIASNGAGVWNETGAQVALMVSPFFWQTGWFLTAALGAFTTAVVVLVRFMSFQKLQGRLRQAEQRAALFQERARIARDIHDDLGGSLAHIKLLSELAAGNRAAPQATQEQFREITAKTRQLLESLNETIWSVNPRNDTLADLISYIGQHTVEFLRAAGIRCELDLPEDPPDTPVTPDVRHHLFLAVKEALTNVARHSAARLVRVNLMSEAGRLRVAIEDDGRGFDRIPDDPLADGIRNMRQRMDAVGGSFRIESRAEHGTRLELEVPVAGER